MAQTKPKAGQFYGVSNNGTDGEFLQTDGTGGMAWASPITNPTIASIDYPGSATAADPAGGESVIINGTLFASGITCTIGGTSAVTAFNSATQITITTPAKAAGPYAVAVANPNGGTASETNFIQYSGVPVWSTAAGTLGNIIEGGAASFQVTATEGSDTIEYAVTTGTLPTGLSLATATGAITGTAPTVSADTTTTFSITATDDENQTSASRSFSITVQNDAPSNHFNTVLYTGNNGTQSITGVGFKPDFTWIKARDNGSNNHALTDSVRGTGSGNGLSSNTTGAEGQYSAAYGYLSAFGTDGFTVQAGSTSPNFVNSSSANYVAWNFKAGGVAVANTDGTINSDVSVNNTLGFSIVEYSGTSINGTIGHGLDSAPELYITKGTDGANAGSIGWYVYSTTTTATHYLQLNSTNAASDNNLFWNDTEPTASVFSVANNGVTNGTGENYIAYCFTSKPGFSKVGSYTGNGSTSGPIVQTGFEPAFVMLKCTTAGGTSWRIVDNKRNTSNPRNEYLEAQSGQAELTYDQLNFYSNGFQVITTDTSINANGSTVFYLAVAADGSTATPSLANSFATEIYTGNGGTKSVTTGFKPDFTWVKARNVAYDHGLVDSVRGITSMLYPNETYAASTSNTYIQSFDSNGFTWGSNNKGNANGTNYVSWNWKTGGTPSINTDGTITSVVSANQAAGFSIVSYTANATSGATIGHNLGGEPDMVIVKSTNLTQSWNTYIKDITDTNAKYLMLNSDSAISSTANPRFIPGNFSSTVFSVGNDNSTNGISGTDKYIAYCFKSISGYSKVGTYTGLGSGGPLTVNMGFAPTLGLIKKTTGTGGWRMFDTVRGTNSSLRANINGAQYTDSANYMDFTSTGFYFSTSQTNSDINAAGETYIYLAIKEN